MLKKLFIVLLLRQILLAMLETDNSRLLTQIIDKPCIKLRDVELEFPSENHAFNFKKCLKLTPVTCWLETEGNVYILHVRPKELGKFKLLLEKHGLGNCEASLSAYDTLCRYANESVRFITVGREGARTKVRKRRRGVWAEED